MIARYSRPAMSRIWSDQNRYFTWLRVETAVCEELAQMGRIPPAIWSELQPRLQDLIKKGGVSPVRVDELELVTKHDVIAFTTAVAEVIGPTARYVHFGLTSSDVVDTSLSILILESGQILMKDVELLCGVLKKQATRYKDLACIGRSHGIAAEPTSFGLKFLSWYAEWERNRLRLEKSLERIQFGKLSGAVGVNSHWEPAFEERVLNRMGLQREPVATQVIPRDRHAEVLNVMSICAGSMERICIELRHLQRSEVGEVEEGFAKGQKGSSAMPHKKNPISAENLTGCARLIRSYAQAQLENIALWHERDISHSSVERITFPDAFILMDYSLHRLIKVLDNLVVKEEQVRKNLTFAGPVIYSGHVLLALVQAGAERESAYYWVQECSHKALDQQWDMQQYIHALAHHPQISEHLKEPEIQKLGSLPHQLRNVDAIFERVLGKNS